MSEKEELKSNVSRRDFLKIAGVAGATIGALTAIDPDPIGAWRRDDRPAIRGLALLEIHAAGVKL